MFRSESESEKPLEGTSRSASPINSFPLSASPGKHSASLTGCSAPLLLSDRRTPACSSSPSHCPLPCRKARGLDTEEEGKPSTGTRNAQGPLQRLSALPQSAGRRNAARRARRGQVHIVPFGWTAPSSPHSSGSTLQGGSASRAATTSALSALPAPRGGAPRVTHSHPERPPRELGCLLAPLLSLLHRRLPTPPLPAPRLSSPTPAPRPGLSTTSLRSWRPHVFTRLPALVDVVSRSDFQARPQLRRQHQPGPSCAPRSCARKSSRARLPPLSRPRRPQPAQPQPRAQRTQPCHLQHKAAPAARTSASGAVGGRRGNCRRPAPFSRRRRRES